MLTWRVPRVRAPGPEVGYLRWARRPGRSRGTAAPPCNTTNDAMSQGHAADARGQARGLATRLIAGNTQLCAYLVQGGLLRGPPSSLLCQAGWPGRAKPQNRWRRVLGTHTTR